jgi:hypothetical protein
MADGHCGRRLSSGLPTIHAARRRMNRADLLEATGTFHRRLALPVMQDPTRRHGLRR